MTTRDPMKSAAGDFVDGLNTAIRDNPLAAGLIGAGVAWMLMGGTKGLGLAAAAAKTAATTVGSAGVTAGSAVSRGVGEAGSRIASTVRQAGNSVSDTAGTIASIVPDLTVADTEKVADRAYEAVAGAGSVVRDHFNAAASSGHAYGTTLQSKLSESLERQPMLLGALGLVIGAGIASTFATTALESEWIGEQGEAVRKTVQSAVDEAKDRASQVVSDVKNEAFAQGLTPAAAKDAASGVLDKVKTVAGAARDSVGQRFAETSNG